MDLEKVVTENDVVDGGGQQEKPWSKSGMNKLKVPPGRPKTSLNRAAISARKAVTKFVESNTPKFGKWIDQVVTGIPKVDEQGTPLRDKAGSIIYVVRPDPLAALKAVADIMEYHLPKLSRTEVNQINLNVDGGEMTPETIRELSIDDLKRMVLSGDYKATAIDVEASTVIVDAEMITPMPDWLKPVE